MIIIGPVILDSRVMNSSARTFTIIFNTAKKRRMCSVGWSLEKGDWWKDESEKDAKFMSYEWKTRDGPATMTGVYFGRLAIVYRLVTEG